jgi:hypothetical protein
MIRCRLLLGLAGAIGFASALLAGCGDDSGADDGGLEDVAAEDADVEALDGDVTPEVDADVEAGADGDEDDAGDGAEAEAWDGGGDGVLTVRVVTWVRPPGEFRPIGGATVALDAPAGGVTEARTGADGRVTFSTLDWSAGPAAVTAHAEGFIVTSRVDVTAAEGEVVLPCGPADGAAPTSWPVISGDAAGMLDESHGLGVTTTASIHGSAGTGPSWQLAVPPDTPFTLVAQEQHPDGTTARIIDGWTMLEVPALAASTTLALDFATPLTPVPVTNSVRLPPRADSPLRSRTIAYWWATSLDSDLGLTVGQEETTVRAADGDTWDLHGEYVVVPGVEQPVAFYVLWEGMPRGLHAYAIVDGYPTDGAQTFQFLDVPRMISPPDAVERHPLRDPIEWESFDEGTGIGLLIYRSGEPVWLIVAHPPTEATTMTVPHLPSTTSDAELLGTTNVRAQLFACSDLLPVQLTCRRATKTGQFVLQP